MEVVGISEVDTEAVVITYGWNNFSEECVIRCIQHGRVIAAGDSVLITRNAQIPRRRVYNPQAAVIGVLVEYIPRIMNILTGDGNLFHCLCFGLETICKLFGQGLSLLDFIGFPARKTGIIEGRDGTLAAHFSRSDVPVSDAPNKLTPVHWNLVVNNIYVIL
ncbi:hypothetical protein D3C85_317830 [compost metagenome]